MTASMSTIKDEGGYGVRMRILTTSQTWSRLATMPPITSGKILLTGANGFIAVWVIQDLLEHGFGVRGTVRSESRAGHLRELFKPYGDRFEVVIVDDITKEGAFDTALSGVDAVVHNASPVILDSTGPPEELILPAVNGTKSILSSVLKAPYRTSIKRVLYLSSTATVWDGPPDPKTGYLRGFEESSWNKYSLEQIRKRGTSVAGLDKYRAGKTLAERALWEAVEQEKNGEGEGIGELGWDLVTLNPARVIGPMLHEAPTPERFSAIPKEWYDRVVKRDMQEDSLTKNIYDFVDVRDLARAHVLAITLPEAGGERFLISGHSSVWQQFVDEARRYSKAIPAGESYQLEDAIYVDRYDSTKSRKMLGLTYRPLEETTKDIVEDLQRRGWL
ncbi:NAD(P)-binding protein [Fomes fomentarius]|nr:NAD(P)-binding protein [Fomes fomentarius]